MTLLDKKIMFTREYSLRAPKSVCICGHTGDGAHSDHRDVIQLGHGACAKCACEQFAWAGFTLRFNQALAKVK